jgi:serine protease Do
MRPRFARTRLGVAVASAFVGGMVLTAAFDLTKFGYAQQTGPSRPTPSQVRSLEETGNAFVSIAEHVTPAVVSISAESDAPPVARGQTRRQMPPGWEDFFRQFGGQPPGPTQSSGTGFLVTKDGYILTNNHVVEGADRLLVTLHDGRTFRAQLVGRDPDTDVAVIKIEGNDFPMVAFGDDDKLRIGEWVVAIGNPLGLNFSVTAGIVSAKGRDSYDVRLPQAGGRNEYAITDLIQTDAAINPGNSGGPLVNIRGEVIGINNAIASQTGYFAGYGFAIPITLARDVMSDLVKHGRVRRAVIGVQIRQVNEDDAAVAGMKEIRGAIVGDFNEGSPAKKAGLEVNDVIIAINGQEVDKVSTLQRLVRGHEPGETVSVDVMRYGQQRTFKVRLDEAPAAPATVASSRQESEAAAPNRTSDRLGIVVEPVTPQWAQARRVDSVPAGIAVAEVLPDGPARERLNPGDVITGVIHPAPERPIRTAADLQQVLARMKSGDYLTLRVYSAAARQSRVVNMRVGAEP